MCENILGAAIAGERPVLPAKAQCYRKGAAGSDSAFHLDMSAHHLDDVFGDGKSETSAVNAAEGGVLLSFKRFKNAFQGILADADAGILNGELVDGIVVGKLF